MKTVYVETSIVSYLTARPTQDLRATARQHVTREWWDNRRRTFDLFVSPLVYEEARRGDSDAARRRVEVISELATLQVVDAGLRSGCGIDCRRCSAGLSRG